jgi:NTE family protein
MPQPPVAKPAPRIGLALGGGAARGFAHIGVIKALEAQGIRPDIITGTSAGAVIGALHASGLNGFQLQKLALDVEESTFTDWSLPDRGMLRGEALQEFINRSVQNRTLEKLARPLGVVATDLASGERVVFRTGNTGMAVRASSAVPGVFKPINIHGKDYVDGGLTSPVPVQAARAMGADFVIAVEIGLKPEWGKTDSTLDVLLQTFTIMGNTLARHELKDADVVIRPNTAQVNATDFEGRHLAILEGEKATARVLGELKDKLARARPR